MPLTCRAGYSCIIKDVIIHERRLTLTTPADPSRAVVSLTTPEQLAGSLTLPDIVRRAGQAAVLAAEMFFYGRIRNENTRTAYRHAVDQFLAWCESRGLELARIASEDVTQYFGGLRKTNLSIATRKQHLAAIRHFFDSMVTRHAIILNPALSIRGDRCEVIEGKTPEISVPQARKLLASIDVSDAVGLRDHAVLAILAYTSSRAGAVSKLRRGDLYDAGEQWTLRFEEKGGKFREIPVRHDLQQMIAAYIEAAGLQQAPKDTPLFRAAIGKTGQLAATVFHSNDICRMMKRRLADASLPARLSPHSFRAMVITDLLEQGVPLDDVQQLAGHADPRTTRLYDRRQKKVTRNIVERISI
jgi:integrase/recombinase XerD